MTNPEDPTHLERFDDDGAPTGRSMCGVEGGRFATATWWADCEACIDAADDAPIETER